MAEGQPRNILDIKLSRFGGGCRGLSRRRHHVIHNCYAFSAGFRPVVAAVGRVVVASGMLNVAQTPNAASSSNQNHSMGLTGYG
ncbi:hypothetical protein [Bradyrhizobium ivorense]|uniref:hypothetical protein n=1 Tax=Bradyrhizobium ivorense TaxID=2511166 RepID=UPI0011237BD1|nr:hypothetical protein [Bradyrhizobium ivorense]